LGNDEKNRVIFLKSE